MRLMTGARLAAGVLALAVTSTTLAAAAAAPPATAGSGLAWSSCGPKTDPASQCAQLTVPMDWSKPHGEQTTLAVARHPATDQAHKVGTLLFLPGPGVSIVNQVAWPASGGLGRAPELAKRFDLVGIDLRGGGMDLTLGEHDATVHSPSLNCTRQFNDPDVTRYPRTRAEYAALATHNRTAALSCAELAGHLGARDQTRDIEALRAALGEERLSVFSFTYASLIAQTYAAHYPTHVRAMVIDSPLDHSVPAKEYVRTQVRTTEQAFRRFVAWCDETPSCALHGQDVARIYGDLLRQADRSPIPVAGVDHPLTGEEISYLAMYVLENGRLPLGYGGWADLAYALSEAQHGNYIFGQAYPYNFGPAYYDPYRAGGCLDYPTQAGGYHDFQALRREVLKLAPNTRAASDSWDFLSGCVGWPYPSQAPRLPVEVRGAPPILLVVSRHNPLAPYPLAIRVAGQIENSVVLTYEQDAHIAYFNSRCVGGAEQSYLVTGLPPAVRTCSDIS